MNFVEIRFWVMLAAGLGAICLVRTLLGSFLKDRQALFDRASLFALGLFLLACVSTTTVVIYLVVTLGSYAALAWLTRHPQRDLRPALLILIPLQLLPLLYYKYAHFLLNDVFTFQWNTLRDLVIPVGISFYTFQVVGFIVDTLGFRKPLPGFLDFMNFAGFFPQIVAGPIERRADLLPQMESFRLRWHAGDLNEGATWIVLGLFLKLCLADNAALYFHGQSPGNPFLVWLDNLLFGLRIYYDFAGYSLIAVGLGRCFGIRLTLNFLSPYCSTSITEFWRRWHITLSQWFRDYVYVPLGGSRTPRWWINIAVVFVVSGIWHGAGWNFVAWGALHGGFLIANRLLGPRLQLPRTAAWGLTFAAAMFAWLCFYETRTAMMFGKLQTLLSPGDYTLEALREALGYRPSADLFVLGCLLVLTIAVMTLEWLSILKRNQPYALLRTPVALVVLVLLTVWLSPGKNNAFIYFAF
jgi:D-alanyl-lipoteichoic acid acyltransferase DltB (MBOAT superfamily)